MLINTLETRVRAVAPIFGVAIGSRSDKATWRIDFQSNATASQIAAAQSVIDAFDIAAETTIENQRIIREESIRADANGDVFVDKLRNATPDQIRTFVSTNVTDLASAKILIARMAIAIAYLLRNE
jgi:hypothetical protein